MREQATIDAVARRAGVSVASVSRVFSGAARVAPDTAGRIRQAATELGYVPNHSAASLKRRRTGQIAFSLPDIGNPVYVAMARAIEAVARERGTRLFLLSTDADAAEEIGLLRDLNQRFVDGLIMCPLRATRDHVAAVQRAAAPVVFIGALPADTPADLVSVDSQAAARLAIDHLLDLGRRRVALVGGPPDTHPGAERLRGYTAALTERGLPLDTDLMVTGDFRSEGGYTAAARLLALPEPPDAIFCANDLMALGALRRIDETGLRVPQDIALVGIDDIEQGRLCRPALTSVSLRPAERGRQAAETLFARLAGPWEPPWQRLMFTPVLVARASTQGGRP